MPKARRVPQRTCVGCGEVAGKRELLRIVRSPDGEIELDPTGKRNGRGAYIHRQASCFERAAGRLAHGLRMPREDVALHWPALRAAFTVLAHTPAPRPPQVHRAPGPLPDHLVARNLRGPARTPARVAGREARSGTPPVRGTSATSLAHTGERQPGP